MGTLLEDALKYARVDQRETECGAKIIFDAAEAYITEAIDQKCKMINDKNPAYRLAVCMLFSHWYDNREAIGSDKELGFGLRNLISQLQAGALQEEG